MDCPFLSRWDDDADEELETSVWISQKTRQLELALAAQSAQESYIKAVRLLRSASTASSRAAMALIQPLISRSDLFVDVELESSVEEWILHKTCQLESALGNRDVRASYIEDLHLLATASTAPSLTAILRQTPSLHLLSIGPPEIDGSRSISICAAGTILSPS